MQNTLDGRRVRAILLITTITVGGCGAPQGEAPDSEAAGPAGGAITLWTDSTELFMEHPALIVGAPDKFAVHLTDLTDFAPLRTGRITLSFAPQGGGAPLVVTQEEPRAPGIYGPSPDFTQPGLYDLTITVESPQARDVIQIPGLRVYATAAEAPLEEGGEPNGISFLKEQQWKTPGLTTAFATSGSVAESFLATGRLIPASGGFARISAPVAGTIEMSGATGTPAPGQRVTRGQVLAILTPALGDGGSSYAEARAELREAEHEHARATRLFAAEAIPERRVFEAENRLTAAREALVAFGAAGAARADGRIELRSPISGAVGSATLSQGGRVDAGTELFTIVDPSTLWLQAQVSATDAVRVGNRGGASFTVPGSAAVRQVRRTVSVASVIDSVSRSVPVIYEVTNPDGLLKIGMTAQVLVLTGDEQSGIVIPTSAILDEDGRPVAYVQTEGELFERRELVLGATDGLRAVITSGIAAGERVVTGAAYQIRLASLSTSVPVHGHEH
jgi:cobalt-zinc-cadmium efflux system membrane fusion protein